MFKALSLFSGKGFFVWRFGGVLSNSLYIGKSVDPRTIVSYITLYGLIVLYAHAYSVWAFLSAQLGVVANYVPIVLSVLVLATVIAVLVKKGSARPGSSIKAGLKIHWLIAGLLCVVIALALPDSSSPAKRIHVPEYLLLSFAIFTLLRQKLTGVLLIIFCVLITTLYGAHDEMIQGLLPSRSFGFKDIMVDALSGLGGACIAYAPIQNTTRDVISKSFAFRRGKSGFVARKWFAATIVLVITQVFMVASGSNESTLLWVVVYALIASGSYWFSLNRTNAWCVNKPTMFVIYCLVFSLPLYLSSTALITSLIFK